MFQPFEKACNKLRYAECRCDSAIHKSETSESSDVFTNSVNIDETGLSCAQSIYVMTEDVSDCKFDDLQQVLSVSPTPATASIIKPFHNVRGTILRAAWVLVSRSLVAM